MTCGGSRDATQAGVIRAVALATLVLAACTDDPTREHLDRFIAKTELTCWSFGCNYPVNYFPPPPTVPIEDGRDCMNAALADGTRAEAYWDTYDFGRDTVFKTYVFTVDHQFEVFRSSQAAYGPEELSESPLCAGPLGVADYGFCAARANGQFVNVAGLAVDACR